MKSISHSAKLKFDVGEKVYYKHNGHVKTTTIRKIVVETSVTKKSTSHSVSYVATAYGNNSYSYYRRNRYFKENQIFNSKETVNKKMIPTEKSKILKGIKQVEKNITQNKQAIKKAKNKLDEIRKEELVEQLSGIA